MATTRLDFSLGGLQRAAGRVKRIQTQMQQIEARALTTVTRRIGTEATRLIAAEALNLPQARVRQHLKVEKRMVGGASYISVQANKVRLPLILYTPRFNRTAGVTVTTWRDQGPQRMPHAFKRRDRPGVWQRVPLRKGGADLVPRLPVVERKGPSLHRVFETRGRAAGHGNVIPKLSTFVEQILSLEIARLLRAS